MEIGRSQRNVAQRWSLERAPIALSMRHHVAAFVGDLVLRRANPDVVILVVREQRIPLVRSVAGSAVPFFRIAEDFEPALRAIADRLLIMPVVPAIKWRIAADHGAL